MKVRMGNIALDTHAVFELSKIRKDVVDSFASLKACFLSSQSVYSDWRLILVYPNKLSTIRSIYNECSR